MRTANVYVNRILREARATSVVSVSIVTLSVQVRPYLSGRSAGHTGADLLSKMIASETHNIGSY